MTKTLRAHEVGLVFGSLLGGWHLLWSLLVATGWAEPVMDFILRLHMIQLGYHVLPFSFSMAVGLIVVTSLLGYVIGYLSGLVWNALHKEA